MSDQDWCESDIYYIGQLDKYDFHHHGQHKVKVIQLNSVNNHENITITTCTSITTSTVIYLIH